MIPNRLARFGSALPFVPEVVVKNGAGALVALSAGCRSVTETPDVSGIRDTTGAGDAFNAGYLSARLAGKEQVGAVLAGQHASGEAIRHFGARIPKSIDLHAVIRNKAC